MKKVIDYKLVVFGRPEHVAEMVNEEIRQNGYELFGTPSCSVNCYSQALVKYEDSEVKSEEVPSTSKSHFPSNL